MQMSKVSRAPDWRNTHPFAISAILNQLTRNPYAVVCFEVMNLNQGTLKVATICKVIFNNCNHRFSGEGGVKLVGCFQHNCSSPCKLERALKMTHFSYKETV